MSPLVVVFRLFRINVLLSPEMTSVVLDVILNLRMTSEVIDTLLSLGMIFKGKFCSLVLSFKQMVGLVAYISFLYFLRSYGLSVKLTVYRMTYHQSPNLKKKKTRTRKIESVT